MVDAYGRVPNPSRPDEDILKWGLRVSTSIIYYMLTDFLALIWNLLTKWHELTAERRFGSMLLLLLLITNIHYSLKERGRKKMLSVSCENHGGLAVPIPGSYNRYYCRKGRHQFADDPHRF